MTFSSKFGEVLCIQTLHSNIEQLIGPLITRKGSGKYHKCLLGNICILLADINDPVDAIVFSQILYFGLPKNAKSVGNLGTSPRHV
jgi:hypothetical protein